MRQPGSSTSDPAYGLAEAKFAGVPAEPPVEDSQSPPDAPAPLESGNAPEANSVAGAGAAEVK